MRLEALLLAFAGLSIRAEVVDYGECFFPLVKRKSCFDHRESLFSKRLKEL